MCPSMMMKAIVCTKYGSPDVLKMINTKKPVPNDNEVLIKVLAASVTRADCMMRAGTPFYARLFMGFMRPEKPIPGTGFAGVVESVGKAVKQFKVGSSVFGETGMAFSANAEFICIPENTVLSVLPDNITYDEAAPICDGALTSLSFLKDIGKLQNGQKVLINGASGSLGSAAIQIAKNLGAEVTGVCSTENMTLVKSLGADKIIDYTKKDFTEHDSEYDIVFDTVGKSSFIHCKQSLRKNGVYLSPVFRLHHLLLMLLTSIVGTKKAKFSATGIRPVPELMKLIDELKIFFAEGKLKSVMDRRYSLNECQEAHLYIEQGHKKGNVILVMNEKG